MAGLLRFAQVGFVAGFAAMVLAACQPEDKPKNEFQLPASKASGFREQSFADANQENKALIRSLRESHEIFQEVFNVVWNDSTLRTNSVFRQVEKLLMTSYDDQTGQSFQRENKCSGIRYLFKVRGRERSLSEVDCRTQPEVVRVLLKVQDLGNRKYRWQFETSNLAQGAGMTLSTLGADIYCNVEYVDNSGQLKRLACKNLGQNLDRNQYLLFSEYQFLRGQQMMMLVRGQKFSDFGKMRSTFDMPIPLEGKILYQEKMLEPEAGVSAVETTTPPPVVSEPGLEVQQAQTDVAPLQAPKKSPEVNTDSNPAVKPAKVTGLPDQQQGEDHTDLFPQCNEDGKIFWLKQGTKPESVGEDCELIEPAAATPAAEPSVEE